MFGVALVQLTRAATIWESKIGAGSTLLNHRKVPTFYYMFQQLTWFYSGFFFAI